jgi:hypothetical protein
VGIPSELLSECLEAYLVGRAVRHAARANLRAQAAYPNLRLLDRDDFEAPLDVLSASVPDLPRDVPLYDGPPAYSPRASHDSACTKCGRAFDPPSSAPAAAIQRQEP